MQELRERLKELQKFRTAIKRTQIARLPAPAFPPLLERFFTAANARGNEFLNHERK